MNKLRFKNQRKALKIIVSMCDNSPTQIVCCPTDFESSFPFLDSLSLVKMLEILNDKKLIQVQYANLPENFNIHTLSVTPAGLDFEPQASYDTLHKWLDRLWGFIAGLLLGIIPTVITWLIT